MKACFLSFGLAIAWGAAAASSPQVTSIDDCWEPRFAIVEDLEGGFTRAVLFLEANTGIESHLEVSWGGYIVKPRRLKKAIRRWRAFYAANREFLYWDPESSLFRIDADARAQNEPTARVRFPVDGDCGPRLPVLGARDPRLELGVTTTSEPASPRRTTKIELSLKNVGIAPFHGCVGPTSSWEHVDGSGGMDVISSHSTTTFSIAPGETFTWTDTLLSLDSLVPGEPIRYTVDVYRPRCKRRPLFAVSAPPFVPPMEP
jgi:hypothetical protein